MSLRVERFVTEQISVHIYLNAHMTRSHKLEIYYHRNRQLLTVSEGDKFRSDKSITIIKLLFIASDFFILLLFPTGKMFVWPLHSIEAAESWSINSQSNATSANDCGCTYISRLGRNLSSIEYSMIMQQTNQ